MRMPTDTFRDEEVEDIKREQKEAAIALAECLQNSTKSVGVLTSYLPNCFSSDVIDGLDGVVREVAARLRNDCQAEEMMGRLRVVKMIVDEALKSS